MKKKSSKKDYKIIEEIHTGGSDRSFLRCIKDGKTYIIIRDKDIQDYVRLQKHLFKRGIAVPHFYRIDKKMNLVLAEDLGKDSLYTLITKKKRSISRLYRRTIDELVKLQIDGYPKVPINLYYDYRHIKWEQEYFRQFFLHQLCKIPNKRLQTLDTDFEHLSEKLIDVAKPISNFLMHRDYQSQNIYVKNRRIRIIDFQSARIGPLTYDLASLLKDPYVNISKKLEARLINYYLDCLATRKIDLSKKRFLETYRLTGLQRNMQALGAFANLLLNKNKIHFQQHIPRGLKLLKSGLRNSEFKKLYRIVDNIEHKNVF